MVVVNTTFETPTIPNGGQLIRYARKLRGYTIDEYAYSFGISSRTLGGYERGEFEPQFFTVISILKDLNVELMEAYQNAEQQCTENNQADQKRAA